MSLEHPVAGDERKDENPGTGTVAMVDLKSSPFSRITEEHTDYELAISIQNGLRGSLCNVPLSEPQPIESVDPREYTESIVHRFSSTKDESKEQLFIEYAPKSFAKLRRAFQITDDDYLSILTGDDQGLLSFLSNSKSGQYFFFSNNSQFIIKTMSKSELEFLLQILPSYCQHMLNEANSLIARFYGIYKLNKFRINRSNKDISFLISNNVFYSPRRDLVIREQYDLKGSTQGRLTPKEDVQRSGSILKDVNFIEDGVRLNISNRGRAKVFHSQIERDCKWFARNLIMDYSLLVGIADLKGNGDGDGLSADNGDDQSLNVFCREHGGMVSDDGTKVYFVGIIDILQKYNKKKKAAAFVKGIKYESNTLSTVPPDLYAKRFCEFFTDRVF